MAPGSQEADLWRTLRLCGEAGVPALDELGRPVDLVLRDTSSGGHVVSAEAGNHKRVVDLETAVELNANWVDADTKKPK